jgi:hypothetical protein
VTLDGKDVPVKLKVFDSLFVPLAKWSMLLTGNYRCITPHEPQSIRDAVHGDLQAIAGDLRPRRRRRPQARRRSRPTRCRSQIRQGRRRAC